MASYEARTNRSARVDELATTATTATEGLIKKRLVATKFLSSTLTPGGGSYLELTDLATTLVEGATYEFHFNYNITTSAATQSFIVVSLGDNENNIIQVTNVHVDANRQYQTGSISHVFTADATAQIRFFFANTLGASAEILATNTTNVNPIPGVTNGSTNAPSTFMTIWRVEN
jgi:hypothetical protein